MRITFVESGTELDEEHWGTPGFVERRHALLMKLRDAYAQRFEEASEQLTYETELLERRRLAKAPGAPHKNRRARDLGVSPARMKPLRPDVEVSNKTIDSLRRKFGED